MEKKWVGSVFVILGLVLLVFAVGYSAGNEYTGYSFFSQIFGKKEATKTTTVASVSGREPAETIESSVIPPKTIPTELFKRATNVGTKLGNDQTRTFGTTIQGVPLTGGCDVISSSSETSSLGLLSSAHAFCDYLGYDYCATMQLIHAQVISCDNRVLCNDERCLARWEPVRDDNVLFDVTVTCCSLPS